MTCWARGTTRRASVAPSGISITHGDAASTRKKRAAVSRTPRSTSDKGSMPAGSRAADTEASSEDTGARGVPGGDATARIPDVWSFRPVTTRSYTPRVDRKHRRLDRGDTPSREAGYGQ